VSKHRDIQLPVGLSAAITFLLWLVATFMCFSVLAVAGLLVWLGAWLLDLQLPSLPEWGQGVLAITLSAACVVGGVMLVLRWRRRMKRKWPLPDERRRRVGS